MINFSKTQTYTKCCIALCYALLISGCGEFAYKRGASASDLENTKKACLLKSSDHAIFEKCMQDNGWIVQNLGNTDPVEPEPVLEVSIIPNNRQAEKPVIVDTKTIATDKSLPDTKQLPPLVKKVANPMETFKISSWWKLGGGAENLKLATDECVTELGEIHKPNTQTHQVTRGLLLCMNGKGWRGLREK